MIVEKFASWNALISVTLMPWLGYIRIAMPTLYSFLFIASSSLFIRSCWFCARAVCELKWGCVSTYKSFVSLSGCLTTNRWPEREFGSLQKKWCLYFIVYQRSEVERWYKLIWFRESYKWWGTYLNSGNLKLDLWPEFFIG